jgi:hypothetical protein
MYLEIDNKAPVQAGNVGILVPIKVKDAVTVIQFPEGIDLAEAIVTAREVIGYHVADGKIKGFRSDNPDLVSALEAFYGLKATPKSNGGAATASALGTLVSLSLAGLVWASTQLQLRYNNGASWQAGIMGNPSSTGTGAYAPGIYMGLSSDSTAPAVGDSALVGEITSGTLARALASYGYTTAATSYTQSKVFTSDQTVTIYKSALFTVASGGSPIFGSLLTAGGVNSPKSLFSGDQVGVTETVSF